MNQSLLKKTIAVYVAIAVVAYALMGVAYRESVEPIIWLSILVVTMVVIYICGTFIVVDKSVNQYRRKVKALDRELKVAREDAKELRNELVQSIPALLMIFAEFVRLPEGMKGDKSRVYFSNWITQQLQDPDSRLLAAIKTLRMYKPAGSDLEWFVAEFLSDMSEAQRKTFIDRIMGICTEELFGRPDASQ